MLVKKLYGCVDNSEYENYGSVMQLTSNFQIEAVEAEIPGSTPVEKDK